MKSIKFFILAGIFTISAFANENNKPVQTDYKDAFLSFALDKAKLYSGKAENAIEKGVDLAMQEAKPTAEEFLRWRLWMHGVKAFTSPFLLICFIGLQMWVWPRFEFGGFRGGEIIKGNVCHVVVSIIAWFGMLISTLVIFIFSMENFMSFIQVLVAPRIYIIEQVISIMK